MKAALRFALLGFLVPAVVACSLAASADEPTKVVTIEGITEYRLDNGLIVLLYPDNSRPTVTTNLTAFVGSRHEGYGETGMAHLLEHMLFKGTPTHPRVDKVLRERGASYNGTTNDDRTNYFETLPASDENLEFAIRFEADRLINCFVRREDLTTEMTVVRNEFERGENSPSGILGQRMAAVAYEWHNYGKSTIGNRSDIERVPIENLQEFYRKFYQPDNAMLVVAGQFEEKKALAHVQKYFGSIPRPKRKLPNTYTEEPAQDGERTVVLRRVGEVGLVSIMYHIPAGPHADFVPMQVLASALTRSPSGRLYKALVESKKATDVSGFAAARHDPGIVEFSAEVRKDGSLEEVRDMLIGIVENAASEGVTQEEIDRVKLASRNANRQSLANSSQFAVQLSNWAAMGDWRLYFVNRDRMEKVTTDDVRRVAGKYLRQSNRTVGLFIPTDQSDRSPVPATPDVPALVASYKGRETISAGEAFEPTYENIESRTRRSALPEGIKVSLLPKKTRDEQVTLVLTLRYGNAENLKEMDSAASFLTSLMTRATKKLSRQQLQDELAKLEARIGSGAFTGGRRGGGGGGGGGTPGSATFSVSARRSTFRPTLELFRQVLREPALLEEDFDEMKRSRMASLEQQRTDPSSLASKLLSRELSPFPKGDVRYVGTLEEDIELLRGVSIQQVKKLYDEYLGTSAGELSIVGDFDPDEIMPVLAETFSGWTAKQPYTKLPDPPTRDYAGGKHVIVTPDKANANYVAGLVVPMSDDDPDYPALVIANYVLGRGPGSRLWDRVREREGLSYGVGSGFTASSEYKRASLSFNAICNPQNIGKVEFSIRDEIERLLKDGVPAEELDRAKASYLQAQKLNLTSDGAIAGLLATHAYRGRTLAYNIELEKKIAALTPEQVTAAIKKHVDAKTLVVVTAGDFPSAAGGAGGTP
ncbi:MAG: insulinase family protein [Planctomycetia bacterium]|nr:insulinase family protein [Planctomycetia bacterium]